MKEKLKMISCIIIGALLFAFMAWGIIGSVTHQYKQLPFAIFFGLMLFFLIIGGSAGRAFYEDINSWRKINESRNTS